MRLTYILLIACLCLTVFVESSFGRIGDNTSDVESIATIIKEAAHNLGYRAVRGYRPSDEWEAEEKKNLIVSHAYYTLLGKDSDDSCQSFEGRIGVTILIFKDEEVARQHVVKMKEYHLGNIGVKIIRSNEDGFFLKEAFGLYAVVIRGTKVILFDDRSGIQGDVIESLSETVVKEMR